MAENKNALLTGTILNASYKIESLIGSGGFSLVYRARHIGLDATVAIKELFPVGIVVRQGRKVHPVSEAKVAIYQKTLSSFRKEGRCLARLSNCPFIVRCSDYFEESGTGYLVMEYIEGQSLRAIARSYKRNNQTFDEVSLILLLSELLKGLKEVHREDIQHMDIKPENIHIREAEGVYELSNPVLLDFGASRSQTGYSTGSSLLMGTDPYAPIEQMHERVNIGAWTDFYALGITLYELMFRASKIPNCDDRMSGMNSKNIDLLTPAKARGTTLYSGRFLRLIDKCVAIEAKDRPQNVEEIEDVLKDKILSKLEVVLKHKDPLFQYEQGEIYYYSERVPKDNQKATECCRKSAERGHVAAQYNLGLMYAKGEGLARDDRKAAEWFIRAAEQGHADAQFYLGVRYEFGRGVRKDYKQAFNWYQKAANQGHAFAQNNLGAMYEKGKGVPKNDQKAIEWYEKAAGQGNVRAQNNLKKLKQKISR